MGPDMNTALQTIWTAMSLTAFWGAVLTILITAIAFLLSQLTKHRFKTLEKSLEHNLEKQRLEFERISALHLQQNAFLQSQYGKVFEFACAQTNVLKSEYFKLLDHEQNLALDTAEYAKLIREADNNLMVILRNYEGILDAHTIQKVRNVHNTLWQHHSNATIEGIARFRARKGDFYKEIDAVCEFIKPDQILYRLGLIDKALMLKRREDS